MTNTVEKKKPEPDMADVVLGLAVEAVKGALSLVRRVPALIGWAVIVTVLAHPWDRGAAGPDWGAVITLGLPLVLLALVASRVSVSARRLLPWGDVYGPRPVKADFRRDLTSSEHKWAREAVRNWAGHADRVGLSRTIEGKRGPALQVPRIVSISPDPLGLVIRVRPLGGQPVDQLVRAAAGLETCWGSEVRATRDGVFVDYTLVWRDVLEGTRAVDTAALDAPEGWLQ